MVLKNAKFCHGLLKKKRYSCVTDERLIDCKSAHRTFVYIYDVVTEFVHIFFCKNFIFWVTLISRFWVPRFTFHWQYLIGSLSKDVLSDHVNRKWSFLTLRPFFEQILWQIVSIRVKTVSKTNLVASRHNKGEKRISHQDLMIINAFRK